MTDLKIDDRFRLILNYLNQNLYGKEEAIRLALLSAVANESIFFMGPPGTAKSMISSRIVNAFSDINKDGKDGQHKEYFQYLMNEFSTPDEICGPVDLKALTSENKYSRQTKGYLPTAKVAFLDEIWKSGPAILNTLLTIINEKIFYNGDTIEKVPLVSLSAASNELPAKNRGLEALWDRFVLRVYVNPVENEDDFFTVINAGTGEELVPNEEQKNCLLTVEDLKNWSKKIDEVKMPQKVRKVITAIRKELVLKNNDQKRENEEKFYVSDRRWKKIVRILKTCAFINGREEIDLMDCTLIQYCIWNTEKQYEEVKKIVIDTILEEGVAIGEVITEIDESIENYKEYRKGKSVEFSDEHYKPVIDYINKIATELKAERKKYEEDFKNNLFANTELTAEFMKSLDNQLIELARKAEKIKEYRG